MEGTRDYHPLKCSCGEAEDLGTQSSQLELKRQKGCAGQSPCFRQAEGIQNLLSRHKEGKADLCKAHV